MQYVRRTILDQELNQLLSDIQQLASMVDAALEKAMLALEQRDVALAQEVILGDSEVNALRFKIEEDCLRILATQQPLAMDLRVTVAATHIAGELERIGDHAASVANIVELLEAEQQIVDFSKLPKMVKQGRKMVMQSVQAFVTRDVEAAQALMKREDKIDRHYDTLYHEMIQGMTDKEYLQRANYLLWAGRHLERVGDRAVNIAERVVFTVTGRFVEMG